METPKASEILEINRHRPGYCIDANHLISVYGNPGFNYFRKKREAENWLNELDRLREYKEQADKYKDQVKRLRDLLELSNRVMESGVWPSGSMPIREYELIKQILKETE